MNQIVFILWSCLIIGHFKIHTKFSISHEKRWTLKKKKKNYCTYIIISNSIQNKLLTPWLQVIQVKKINTSCFFFCCCLWNNSWTMSFSLCIGPLYFIYPSVSPVHLLGLINIVTVHRLWYPQIRGNDITSRGLHSFPDNQPYSPEPFLNLLLWLFWQKMATYEINQFAFWKDKSSQCRSQT